MEAGATPPLLVDSLLVYLAVAHTIQQNHPRATNTLSQVFVRRTEQHLLHVRVFAPASRGGRQSIVRFEFNQRPNHEA